MPRETRSNRTGTQIGTPRATAQMSAPAANVRLADSSQILRRTEDKTARRRQFVAQLGGALEGISRTKDRMDAMDQDDLKRTAASKFAAGEDPTDVEMKSRAFVSTWAQLNAQKHGAELADRFNADVVANWNPASGESMRERRDAFIRNEMKGSGGTFNDNFNTSLYDTFMGVTEASVKQAPALAVKAQREVGLENFGIAVNSRVQNAETVADLEFNEFVTSYGSLLPGTSRLESQKQVIQQMGQAAKAGTEKQRKMFSSFLRTQILREDGATYATMFAAETQAIEAAMWDHINSVDSEEAAMVFDSVNGRLGEFAAAGDTASIIEIQANVLPQLREKYGRGGSYQATARAYAKSLEDATKVAIQKQSVSSEFAGYNSGMSAEELNKAAPQMLQELGADLNFGVPVEELPERSARLGTALIGLYKGRGENGMPATVVSRMSALLTPGAGNPPEHQGAALRSLKILDDKFPGAAAAILAKSKGAANTWALFKEQGDLASAQYMMKQMSENPEIKRLMEEAHVGELLGEEKDSSETTAQYDRRTTQQVANMVVEGMGLDVDDVTVPPSVRDAMNSRFKFLYAQNQMAGANKSIEEIAADTGTSMGEELDQLPGVYSGGFVSSILGFQGIGRRNTGSESYRVMSLRGAPDPKQSKPATGYMSIHSTNQDNGEGVAENLNDNINADITQAHDVLNVTGIQAVRGRWDGYNALSIMYQAESSLGAVPLTIDIDETKKLFGKPIALTGDIEADYAAFRTLADELGLPKSYDILPNPDDPTSYEVVLRPTFREQSDTHISNARERGGAPPITPAQRGEKIKTDALAKVHEQQEAADFAMIQKGELKASRNLTSLRDKTRLPNAEEVLQERDQVAMSQSNDYRTAAKQEVSTELRRLEGYETFAYDDNGGRSIGYGFSLTANKDMAKNALNLTEGMYQNLLTGRARLSRDSAEVLMQAYLNTTERSLNDKLTKNGIAATLNQRKALLSIVYNGGMGLMGEQLTTALAKGDLKGAANEVLYNSGTQKPKLRKLASRRYEEARQLVGDRLDLLPDYKSYINKPYR